MSIGLDPTRSRLEGVLRELAPAALPALAPEHRLIDDLGFDSVSLARTVVALEDAFGVELPPERLHELREATVDDVARLLDAASGPSGRA